MIKIIIAAFSAWFITHSIKFLLRIKKNRKLDMSQWHKAGGMPSGHAAVVAALIISLYLTNGFDALFAVAFVFSAIVIRDTMIRNKETRHKPLEVLVGVILGAIIGILSSYLL